MKQFVKITLALCIFIGQFITNRLPISNDKRGQIKFFLHKHLITFFSNQNLQKSFLNGYLNKNNLTLDGKSKNPHFVKIALKNINLQLSKKPLVSIIIPVHGKINFTLQCLESISANQPKVSYEIIIVNDMSKDNSLSLLKKISGIKIIDNKINLGFLLSCNTAAKKSSGKYIYFLNNDTEVTKGWLDELIFVFNSFDKVGLVGSKLIYPDGKLQEAGGIVWNDGTAWNFGRNQDISLPEYNYIREADYCSGASILIEKDLFFKLGGFDEKYIPAYCEDTDFCFKVRSAGYKVFYQPFSLVVHHEGISHGRNLDSGIKSFQSKNQKTFFREWKNVLAKNYFEPGKQLSFALDKSKIKGRVLIIDHYVPEFDKDAGSRTIFMWIKLLVKLGFGVKLWPQNQKYNQRYAEVFQKMGVEVTYSKNNFDGWMFEHNNFFDFILLSRPEIASKFLGTCRKYSRGQILYYGHDIHHFRIKRELTLNPTDKRLEKSYFAIKAIEESIWSEVDKVITISKNEAEFIDLFLSKKGLQVQIYNVPCFVYDNFFQYKFRGNRKNILFVAGFNHSPNIDAVFWFVKKIFPLILKAHPDIHLNLVGSNPPESVLRLSKNNVHIAGYVTDNKLIEYYQTSRLAVAPLRFGAGVKGKVIEAMYYGLPIVTTSIGAEAINAKLCIADNEVAFAESAIQLISEDKLWKAQSKVGLNYIQKHYSVSAANKVFLSIFR